MPAMTDKNPTQSTDASPTTTNNSTSGDVSRRRVLKTTAVATGLLAGIGLSNTVAAQETTFQLGGEVAGWQGRSPSSIEGQTNPTLELEAGTKYKITWENLDGAPHNVVIEDANGNNLVRTKLISEQGATQSVTFTASEKMAEYYCEAHPQSMRGNVSISGTAANGTETTTTSTETTTPTETATPTTTSAETSAGTATSNATTTATQTETTTAAPNKTDTGPLMADESCPEKGGNMSKSNETNTGPMMADEACAKNGSSASQDDKREASDENINRMMRQLLRLIQRLLQMFQGR